MHRPTCGILTILLLSAWLVCECGNFFGWFEASPLWTGAFMRVGILTGALWLAHPQLEKLPVKLLMVVIAGVMIVAVLILKRPQAVAMFAGVLILMIKIRPLFSPVASKLRPKRRAPASTPPE